MPNIPNLNLVIQQGDSVRESQNIRNQTLESSQLAAAERIEEENKKRTSIQEPEESERIMFNREESEENRARKRLAQKSKRTKKESAENKSKDPEAKGRLLNTIA